MQSLLVDTENNATKEEQFSKKVEDERIWHSCNFTKVCDQEFLREIPRECLFESQFINSKLGC
jgi:hypothetical protein